MEKSFWVVVFFIFDKPIKFYQENSTELLLMLEHDQAYTYLTPDRSSKRDRGFNKTTATMGTKFGNLAHTHSPVTHAIQAKAEAPLSKLTANDQLKWYESRVA